ncbi:MAG: molybdenum cofactor guanylyltransferase [Candidatus Hydrothermarchaeales archaeon]
MITSIILAGGRSERFGRDKKFIEIKGKSFIQHVIERARKFSDEIVISLGAEEAGEIKDEPDLKVAIDEEKSKGPLVGISSALQYCRGRYVVVLSVDSPFIEPKVFETMIRDCKGYDAVVPILDDGTVDSLHGVYRIPKLREACRKALESGKYAVRTMISYLNKVKFVSVDTFKEYDPDLLTFINVNTEEDLEKLVELGPEN